MNASGRHKLPVSEAKLLLLIAQQATRVLAYLLSVPLVLCPSQMSPDGSLYMQPGIIGEES